MALPDSVGYSAWQPWELENLMQFIRWCKQEIFTNVATMKNLVKQMQKYSSSKNQLYQ